MEQFNTQTESFAKQPELTWSEMGKAQELPKIQELPPIFNTVANESDVKLAKIDTPLSDETKEKLRELGWSGEIIDAIETEEELQVYLDAGLEPTLVNGKWCLCKTDIDLNAQDDFGRTNLERMQQGLAPLDKNGKPLELHHIGQKNDSPLAQLTQQEHRGKGNDCILHDKCKESEIDRVQFQHEKKEHWKAMAVDLENK